MNLSEQIALLRERAEAIEAGFRASDPPGHKRQGAQTADALVAVCDAAELSKELLARLADVFDYMPMDDDGEQAHQAEFNGRMERADAAYRAYVEAKP